MTRKNKDLTLVVNNQTAEIGNIDTNFYTEDKGIASFRFIFRYDNSYIDLIDSGFVPQLDLFHSDGSIWINQPLIMVMPKRGLVQYSIKDNVIIHAGKVDAKVFLKRGNESIHVANFNFNIIDSGITGAVEKEISVNLIENTIRNIIEEEGIEVLDENFMDSISGEVITFVTNNPENFKGEKGDKGDKFTFSELTPEQKLELKGDKGDKGDSIQGPQGIQGERGLQGLTGARGPAGADGMDGQDGADGQDGTVTFEEFTEEQIEQLRGPQGPKGDTGEAGLQGPKGDPGLDGTVSFDELTDEQRLTLKGEKGDKGEDGAISFEELSNEQIAMLKGDKGDPGEIPNTDTWQKYKLTNDNGTQPMISLASSLTTLRALNPGMYYTIDTPISGVSSAGFLTMEFRDDSTVKRVTYRPYNNNDVYIMRYYSATGWSDWELQGAKRDYHGALMRLNGNKSLAASSYLLVPWGASIYNTGGWWSTNNPSRLTVPPGVTKVRISASILWESSDSGYRQLRIKKNGQYSYGLPYDRYTAISTSGHTGQSAVVEVTAGDYFELEVSHTAEPAVALREDPYTWMSIEAVELSKGEISPSFMLVGHRGSPGYVEEHTMEGYQMALDNGADYIELDLQLTSDNKLICMHDSTLDRTTTGTGAVNSKTLSQIQNNYTTKGGKPIPSLADVLNNFGTKVNYYIETKRPFDVNMDAELLKQLAAKGLIGYGTPKYNVIIQSFALESLANIRNQYSNIPLVYLTSTFTTTDINNAKSVGAYAIAPKYDKITSSLVSQAHNAGLKVHTWTVNTTENMNTVINAGVDGLFTNYLLEYPN